MLSNIKIIYLFLLIYFIIFFLFENYKNRINKKHVDLKIALCTMGRKENLYSKEFIDYYIKLGINHIFIYDHNKPNTEKIFDKVENYAKDKVSVYNSSPNPQSPII